MAITLNDLKERLESAKEDITQQNFGAAYTRISNLILVLEESGVIIHTVATIADKKVEMNGSEA